MPQRVAYPDRGDPQRADGDGGAGRASAGEEVQAAAETTAGTVARAVTCSGSPTSGCAAAARRPCGAGVSGARANAPAPARNRRTRRTVQIATTSAGAAARARPSPARSSRVSPALCRPASSTVAVSARPVRVRADNHPVRRRSARARSSRGSPSATTPAATQTAATGSSTIRWSSMPPAWPSSTSTESGPAPGPPRMSSRRGHPTGAIAVSTCSRRPGFRPSLISTPRERSEANLPTGVRRSPPRVTAARRAGDQTAKPAGRSVAGGGGVAFHRPVCCAARRAR